PRLTHERETDPDPDQEPGAPWRGQPGRPAVFAQAVRPPGWRLRPGGRRHGGLRALTPRPLGHGGRQAAAARAAEELLGWLVNQPPESGCGAFQPGPSR